MIAYDYNSKIYCDDCANAIIVDLEAQEVEDTGDSLTYPQGPNEDGGGAADAPNLCGTCGEFLENPLTELGREYVRGKLRENPSNDIYQHWGDYYAVLAYDHRHVEPVLIDVAPLVYRTMYGWRRFIPDITPLHAARHATWILSGWVLNNSGDLGKPMTAHTSVTRGDRVGCWSFMADADPSVIECSIKVKAKPMAGLRERAVNAVNDDDDTETCKCSQCGLCHDTEADAWHCCEDD